MIEGLCDDTQKKKALAYECVTPLILTMKIDDLRYTFLDRKHKQKKP